MAAILHYFLRLPRLRAAMVLRFIGSMVSFRVVKAINDVSDWLCIRVAKMKSVSLHFAWHALLLQSSSFWQLYSSLPFLLHCFSIIDLLQNPVNKTLLSSGRLAYACLDTWIMLKLTGGRHLATEPSNVSATGLYDPFIVSDRNLSSLSFTLYNERNWRGCSNWVT